MCVQRRELLPPDYRIFWGGSGTYRGRDMQRICRLSEHPFYGCASYRQKKRRLRSGRKCYPCRDKQFFVSLNQLPLNKKKGGGEEEAEKKDKRT